MTTISPKSVRVLTATSMTPDAAIEQFLLDHIDKVNALINHLKSKHREKYTAQIAKLVAYLRQEETKVMDTVGLKDSILDHILQQRQLQL